MLHGLQKQLQAFVRKVRKEQQLTGKILTGSMDAYNDFDTPNTVSIQPMEGITVENGQARFTLPACSVVEITLA